MKKRSIIFSLSALLALSLSENVFAENKLPDPENLYIQTVENQPQS